MLFERVNYIRQGFRIVQKRYHMIADAGEYADAIRFAAENDMMIFYIARVNPYGFLLAQGIMRDDKGDIRF